MTRRRPYCRDRMCGASDCSTCYGPGYDREDDDESEEDVEEDVEEDEEEPDEDPGPDLDNVAQEA